VWQLVHPKVRAAFPPLTSLSARYTNLPNDLGGFVGRDQAIAELCDLLANSCLLTLTGPGGIGKARLALLMAGDALANYPHGMAGATGRADGSRPREGKRGFRIGRPRAACSFAARKQLPARFDELGRR